MDMYFKDGIEMIRKGFEKRTKKEYWDMWLTAYPNMTEKTYISFDDFFSKSKTPNNQTTQQSSVNNKKSKEEILTMAEKIKLADMESRKKRAEVKGE